MTTARMRTGLMIAIAFCLSGQGPVALAAPALSAFVSIEGGGRPESHGPTVPAPDGAIEVELETLGAISEAKRWLVDARVHIRVAI